MIQYSRDVSVRIDRPRYRKVLIRNKADIDRPERCTAIRAETALLLEFRDYRSKRLE